MSQGKTLLMQPVDALAWGLQLPQYLWNLFSAGAEIVFALTGEKIKIKKATIPVQSVSWAKKELKSLGFSAASALA